jgi:hypothetical protein
MQNSETGKFKLDNPLELNCFPFSFLYGVTFLYSPSDSTLSKAAEIEPRILTVLRNRNYFLWFRFRHRIWTIKSIVFKKKCWKKTFQSFIKFCVYVNEKNV